MIRATKPLSFAPHLLSSHSIPKTLKTLARRTPQVAKPDCRILPAVNLPQVPSNSDADSIRSLLSQSSAHAAEGLDDLLKEFKPRLNSDLVLEVLKSYRGLGRSTTLNFFSWAGFQLGFLFDDAVVEYMADFLGRRKLFDDLKWLLKTVAASKGRVSARTVAICVRFLGRQGKVADALVLFEVMESKLNCPPDNLVFNNVLYVLCKKDSSGGYINVALRIFQRIGQPDVYSYSNVIIGLCKFGRLEDALGVFCKMERGNLAPTRTAANCLIGHLCNLGGMNELVEKVSIKNWRRPFDILVPNLRADSGLQQALEVFWVITKLGLLPSMHIVNELITRLCRSGNVEKAIEILKVVASMKTKFADDSYSIVIRTLCEVRKMDGASNLFESMISLGLKPKLIVYNSMIKAFCRIGNIGMAQKYFDVMNRNRCEPDCATYTLLIHANCMGRNWEAAYGLLMEMVGLGWRPHFDTYKLVDDFLKQNGKLDLSFKLDRKIDVQDLYAHCKAGRLEAAYDKLSSMYAKGSHPPVYARDAFEQAFRKAGKWKTVQEVLKKLEQDYMKSDTKLLYKT